MFLHNTAIIRRPAPNGAHGRSAALVDRVGATASLLCAVHCVLLPFVLALLPLIGLKFLAGTTFERIFVICAATLASGSILTGWRRHRKPHALYVTVPAIVLLLFGVAVDLQAHVVIHTICEVSGGVLLASAHITNLALAHRATTHVDSCLGREQRCKSAAGAAGRIGRNVGHGAGFFG